MMLPNHPGYPVASYDAYSNAYAAIPPQHPHQTQVQLASAPQVGHTLVGGVSGQPAWHQPPPPLSGVMGMTSVPPIQQQHPQPQQQAALAGLASVPPMQQQQAAMAMNQVQQAQVRMHPTVLHA
ncbi:hypothetical protein DUNSADRAFT_1251 [Dunaliella salina]|uniref:Uncharacterized protein n=1 Tax=Dunaliella salina TaxID=3046 RepID=A0ABQ7FXQ4_DUNSA|nr:hypothetical protein DUNSADRAFT_1251 [Dunaliella salina]|eukprot:KAF5827144.1 hypothetical protein DUNSADRAFT_1251 [Dunaliella salina]